MKKVVFSLLFVFLFFPIVGHAVVTNSSSYTNLKLYFFYQDDCASCKEAEDWLKEYEQEDSKVTVEYLSAKQNQDLLKTLQNTLHYSKENYPLLVVASYPFVGFDSKTKAEALNVIQKLETENTCDLIARIRTHQDLEECIEMNEKILPSSTPPESWVFILLGTLGVGILLLGGFYFRRTKSEKRGGAH